MKREQIEHKRLDGGIKIDFNEIIGNFKESQKKLYEHYSLHRKGIEHGIKDINI